MPRHDPGLIIFRYQIGNTSIPSYDQLRIAAQLRDHLMRIGACLQDVRLERFPGLSLEKSADVGQCIGRSPPEASSPRGSGIREAPGTPGHAPAISVRSLCRSALPPRLKAFRTSPRAIREIAGSAAPRVWPAIPRPRLLARRRGGATAQGARSEEHTSELQSRLHLVCRLLLEKKKKPRRPQHPKPQLKFRRPHLRKDRSTFRRSTI